MAVAPLQLPPPLPPPPCRSRGTGRVAMAPGGSSTNLLSLPDELLATICARVLEPRAQGDRCGDRDASQLSFIQPNIAVHAWHGNHAV